MEVGDKVKWVKVSKKKCPFCGSGYTYPVDEKGEITRVCRNNTCNSTKFYRFPPNKPRPRPQ